MKKVDYKLTNTLFNGHFTCKLWLAICPLDSQSPVILILSVLTR